MNYNEFYEQYEELKRKIGIIQMFAEKMLGRGYRNGAEISSIEKHAIQCSYDMYCCGETTTETYYINSKWIDAIKFDENGDYNSKEIEALIFEHRELIAENYRKQKERKEAKEREELLAGLAKIETQERELYEKLKKKFGENKERNV